MGEGQKGEVGMDTTWLVVIGIVVLIAVVFIAVTVKQARDEERRRGGS